MIFRSSSNSSRRRLATRVFLLLIVAFVLINPNLKNGGFFVIQVEADGRVEFESYCILDLPTIAPPASTVRAPEDAPRRIREDQPLGTLDLSRDGGVEIGPVSEFSRVQEFDCGLDVVRPLSLRVAWACDRSPVPLRI